MPTRHILLLPLLSRGSGGRLRGVLPVALAGMLVLTWMLHSRSVAARVEVERLKARGDLDLSMPSMRSVGYRQAWQYLDGELSRGQMVDKAVAAVNSRSTAPIEKMFLAQACGRESWLPALLWLCVHGMSWSKMMSSASAETDE